MNRNELTEYIRDCFSVEGDCPFEGDFVSTVFRHESNRKWFALLMCIPKHCLGLEGDEPIDVLNVKVGPILAGELRGESGIFAAYHMNKNHWLTLALDGSAEDEKIKWLLDVSYDLTKPKRKKAKSE